MTLTRRQFVAATAVWSACPLAAAAPTGLVTGQPEGAIAGMAVLAAGGNAVDAIVTAALVAGVVSLPMTGLGGYGGALIIARPDGRTAALDFNTVAPAAAVDRAATLGWHDVGVPGVLAGLHRALEQFGTQTFAAAVKPAIAIARTGFPVSKYVASTLEKARAQFVKDPPSAKLYLVDGRPLSPGATFRNPDLADLLETLSVKGVQDFYHGATAARIAAASRVNGGLLTVADLAKYQPLDVVPLTLDWHGTTLHTPPPAAGGLTVLQALATLKALGKPVWDRGDPRTIHTRLEALRIAWHDRLAHLGDPKMTDVPVARLLSEAHAAVSAERVRAAVRARQPVDAPHAHRPANGTTHLNAVDARGLMASLTFTHGEAFGAQVTVPGLGLTMGHGLVRFDSERGRPNSIAPGKRPLHNMSPLVLTRGGQPLLAIGAVGGRRIPDTLTTVLAHYLESGDLTAAVAAPRFHTEGDLKYAMEATQPAATVEYLKTVGYTSTIGGAATLNAIERRAEGTLRTAAR